MPSRVQTRSQSDRVLEVIIVGAGLSGIAAAIECALSCHRVTLLESAPQLVEVGAGLQLTPNSTKILKRWGLAESLWKSACVPNKLNIHRYSDGEVLYSEQGYGKKMENVYGSPFMDVHRADLQLALVEKAKSLGVDFRLGEKVVHVDFEHSLVTTESGRHFQGDLVVGADGLWSRCREIFLQKSDKPNPTGDLAYRIIIDSKDIPDDDLREIVTNPAVNFWFGPGGHVVSYSVRATDMFNIVFMYPDDLPPDVSRKESSMEEMRALFQNWDPRLSRFLSLVKHVEKWKLMHRPEMKSWINEKANFALIGDSCHPMLPYLAQGANSAIEDGSVLGLLLGRIESKRQLPQALKMYECLRKARGETIAKEAFKQRDVFHMPDGQHQEARDATLKAFSGKTVTEKFPIRWACPEVQPWLFGYDAEEEVERALATDPFTKTTL